MNPNQVAGIEVESINYSGVDIGHARSCGDDWGKRKRTTTDLLNET